MSAVYTVGTISVTNGSDIVTGSGTAWVGVIQTGWQIKLPNGEIYWVRQVNSATQLQLENDYTGTSQSNQEYIAGPTGGIARALANKVQDLIGDFQSVVDNAGDGKFADGDLAQPGIRFIADEDTGFRRPSSNTLDVVTGGVQRARFSSSGMNLSGLLSGTAVTQSATDTTAGRLMKVRDAGILNDSIGSEEPDDVDTTRIFRGDGNANSPFSSQFMGWTFSRGSGARRTQLVVDVDSSDGEAGHRFFDGAVWSDWKRLYDTRNILGTVSQSSGVPTGAIIERGSNANGEFVRFADGTLICTRLASVDLAAGATSSPAFAATFAGTGDDVSLSIGWRATSDNAAQRSATVVEVGTGANSWILRNTSGTAYSGSSDALLFAIGRWFD